MSLYYVVATCRKAPKARKFMVGRFIVLAESADEAIAIAKDERADGLGAVESWTAEAWEGRTAALREEWKS
jgi:alkanesulfonate monooxygenase SsuD/methylene tetrahydromethanopterin reductase-like flavin-dependent oxidoreductase (luciferase family)